MKTLQKDISKERKKKEKEKEKKKTLRERTKKIDEPSPMSMTVIHTGNAMTGWYSSKVRSGTGRRRKYSLKASAVAKMGKRLSSTDENALTGL
jgi:hypothetical protein